MTKYLFSAVFVTAIILAVFAHGGNEHSGLRGRTLLPFKDADDEVHRIEISLFKAHDRADGEATDEPTSDELPSAKPTSAEPTESPYYDDDECNDAFYVHDNDDDGNSNDVFYVKSNDNPNDKFYVNENQ